MGMFPFMLYYLYFIIPLAPLVYIFIKWRAYQDQSPQDPKLGLKVIVYYFHTLAYHVILLSLVLIAFGLLKGGGFKDELRVGLGMLISGGIIFCAHWLIIKNINKDVQTFLVARVYNGFNLVVIGLLGMAALIAFFILLFKSGKTDIKLPVSGLIVYGIAWLFRGWQFLNMNAKE